MKKIIIALSVLGLALCLSGPLFAQPSPGTQGNNTTPVSGGPIGAPSTAPIGGGAGILITFGIAYAISRFNTKKKEE